MTGKRRRFTPEFKGRVALEALRERDSPSLPTSVRHLLPLGLLKEGEGWRTMDAERNGMGSSNVEGVAPPPSPDPEVAAKATRRTFTPAYKLSIVERADACETHGEIGALLRREGLYSSHLSAWRRAAREGSLRELARRRGPKPSGGKRESGRVRRLERENTLLREELRKARIIIDVQGKVAGLLDVSPGDGRRS